MYMYTHKQKFVRFNACIKYLFVIKVIIIF